MEYVEVLEELKNEIDLLQTIIDLNELDSEKVDITKKKIMRKKECINKIESYLNKYVPNDIEVRLYLELNKGVKPSQAVKKIANDNYMNGIKPSTETGIWNYYKKMKKSIKVIDF